MKNILNRLIQHEELNKKEAYNILIEIAEGRHNHSQISSFLTIYMMRSISLNELEGFRQALIDLCISVDLSEYETIDLCGTGGDGKDTFNISTLSSFVTAGSGIKVFYEISNTIRVLTNVSILIIIFLLFLICYKK